MMIPRRLCLIAVAVIVVFPAGDAFSKGESRVAFQIEVEVQFVEFNDSDVESLAQKGPIEAEALRRLWQEGKGKLVFAPKVVTQSGVEATVKTATEYRYPTQLKAYPSITDTSNVVVRTVESVVVPSDFVTREAGMILSVLPEARRDGSIINLTMSPELVFKPDWKKYGVTHTTADGKEREVHIEQPFFHTRSLSTSIGVANGATVLVGGGMPGKDEDKKLYPFVTARIVDMNGRPMADLSNQ
jgi:hypothetical protein